MYLIIENDSNLKDAYSIRLAETVDLSKCLGKDDFDINSKEFTEKLDKFTEPTTGEAYISKYVGNDFINSDKVTCVDSLTNLEFQIRIYEKYGAVITDDKVIESYNTLLNEYGKTSAYKYKVKYYEDNIDNIKVLEQQENKSKIISEIKKLPSVYRKDANTNNNENSSFLQRKNNAKEKIALYKAQRKANDAKNAMSNKDIIHLKQRGRV